MDLNELIMESLNNTIMEGKKAKQQTAVQFGGSKDPGLKDVNVASKNQAAVEDGLKGDINKKNKNPQGEGGKEALAAVQKNPKLSAAVVAGVAKAGIGAKMKPNPNVKFTPPAPATN